METGCEVKMLLPLGSIDEMDTPVSNRLNVLEIFRKIVTGRGYKEISTPIVEYASTFTNTSVGMKLQDMMKWFNSQGEIEVLRPDWTASIARALVKQPSPYRKWAYQGPIYDRNKPGLEKWQVGIEIIDTPVLIGETECLLMAAAFFKKISLGPILIELAHTGIFDDFIQPLQLNDEDLESLRQAMHDKRKDEVLSLVKTYSDQKTSEEFASLIDAYGSYEILDEYKKRWKSEPQRLAVIEHLQKLVATLKECGIEDVIIDLGQVKQMPYYSGTIFRGFLKDYGDTCFSGGRYDYLYDYFGKRMSAVGLAFNVDALSEKIAPYPLKEKICVIVTEETLAFAESLRDQFKEAILDIQFNANEKEPYDKILYLVKDGNQVKVVE
jgi:ATP phosphoribosyltransferase regulatory subunit